MRSASSQMRPALSESKPAMQFSAVDLPQPEGPRSAMNSPRRMVTVRPSSAAISRSACAKRRVTPSSLSSVKSFKTGFPLARERQSFGLLRSDLLVPDAERLDLRLRFQRLRVRELFQPLVVLRPTVLIDRVLAFLGRHRERHVLHRRPGVEIALVVGQRLRLRL